MSYCLNPNCTKPQNLSDQKFCITCGTKLILRDRYRAIKPIGQGGFGRTFLAIDEDKPSKPPCVIKQFYPQAQGTSTINKAIELFNQEAIRLDELGKHPQIPALLAYFDQDNRQYLIQEFIDGKNIHQELETEGIFSEDKIIRCLDDLLPLLQFIHSQNVIHRDIKPENIIRRKSDYKLVLVDFGASKMVTGTALMRQGTSIGSPEFVSPEQARGQATFASDIYSLGVTCVHLLTQISPFDLYDFNQDRWVWRDYLTMPVSDYVGRILDKMIQSIPANRYQTATEVLKDLHPHQNPTPPVVIAPPPVYNPTPQPTTNIPKKSPVIPSKTTSQIDLELAELQSEFGVKKPPINPPQPQVNKPNSSQPKQTKSQIDLELEEMKKLFGNNP
jgi:serine/threonine protein kinase